MIVLTSSMCFIVSMLLGGRRGVIPRWLIQRRVRHKVGRQHLLRSLYEITEQLAESKSHVSIDTLRKQRAWSRKEIERAINHSMREGEVAGDAKEIRLTDQGILEAQNLVRQHRLWELFLIHFAEIAPSHVDRDADQIEHMLDPEMVAELERLLEAESHEAPVPANPHANTPTGHGGQD